MTMKKRSIFLSAAALLLLAAGCSNNDKVNLEDPKGTVDLAKGLEFRVNFGDYNAEKDVASTRATQKPDTLRQETIDLGDNLLAEVTIQRDTTRTAPRKATRALPDDTYTMLVFQGSFPSYTLKGQVTGTVRSGKFTTNVGMQLAPGPYTFVLHNNLMTYGNTPMGSPGLTLTYENAEKAMIAQTDYTVTPTPDPQYVDFQMQHVGTRMRIKLSGWMPIQATTTASIQDYDHLVLNRDCQFELPLNGSVLDIGNLQGFDLPLTFPASSSVPTGGTYTSTSNEYLYFAPNVSMRGFKIKFTGGQIYNMNMAGKELPLINLPDVSPSVVTVMDSNESYLVNINLKYNFLYLMSNGDTDFLNSTPYTALRGNDGTTKRYVDKHGNPCSPKTPIAIVLSQSKHVAMALSNANGGAKVRWCTNKYDNTQTNTHMVENWLQNDVFSSKATSGYDETWDPSYTTSTVTGNKEKALNPDFPAFKAAAEYNPGVNYTGSPALKWYLPSLSDWAMVFSNLGFGDKTTVRAGIFSAWHGNMYDIAFKQIGKSGFDSSGNTWYWSSSVSGNTYGGTFTPSERSAKLDFEGKDNFCFVRPFVKY